MKRPKHHCRAEGCTAQVFGRMLMCKRHWLMVPQNIQIAVRRSYEGMFTGLEGLTAEQRRARVDTYRATVETAVACVTRREEDIATEGGKIKTVPRRFYGDTDTERAEA